MFTSFTWRLWARLVTIEAVRALSRHKLRTCLTALAIAIGVSAVVLVVSIGEASAARIDAEFEALGDNLVWVEAGSRNVRGIRTGSHGTTSLTFEDAQAILREVPEIKRLSPQVDGHVQVVRSGQKNWYTLYRGESPDYLAIKKWSVSRGELFSDEDVASGAHKILLGQTVAHELFGQEDPRGLSVRMNGQPFEVIGVLEGKGQSGSGADQDDWVLLPYTTAERALRGGGYTWLDDVLCSAQSADDVPRARDAIFSLMRQRHHIEPGDEDDFNIRRPDEAINAKRASGETMSWLLLCVAAISLMLGGVGIMNVMLASVAQRTREIGLRIAIGATPAEVQLQFLGEAVVLSLLGGLAGLALSLAACALFARYQEGALPIPTGAVAISLGASSFTGMLFGFYPAYRASQLDPIEALRQE